MPAWLQALDEAILLFLQTHVRCGIFTAALTFLTHLGDAGLLWLAIAAVLLGQKKTRRSGLELSASLGLTALLCNCVLKPLFARPRPFLCVESLELIIPALDSYSFPSGHASSSLAAATTLTLTLGRRGAWSYLPAGLIAISRSYVGIHYPSDVAAGALLGTGVALLVHRLSRCIRKGRRD